MLKVKLRARYTASDVWTTIICPNKANTLLGAALVRVLEPRQVAKRIVFTALDAALSYD